MKRFIHACSAIFIKLIVLSHVVLPYYLNLNSRSCCSARMFLEEFSLAAAFGHDWACNAA